MSSALAVFRPRRSGVALALLLALLAACNKDPPAKPALDAPKKVTEVSGDVPGFNDFLPPSGSPKLAVKGDGGAAAAVDGGAAPGGVVASKVKLVEAGAEPRAARKYAFAVGKPERRTLTVRQSMQQGPKKQDQPPISVTADFVAKDAKPTGAKLEMKVVKVELADKEKLPPQVAAQAAEELKAFSGLAATFEVGAHGEIGELALAGDPKMTREGAAEIVALFGQIVELIAPPLPEEPIGVGAKWEASEEQDERGVKATSKRTVELKDVSGEGGTALVTLEKKVPRRVVQERAGMQVMASVDATGSYTFAFRFDRVATKVTGEQTTVITNEVVNPDNPKQTQKIVQEAKTKHVLETTAAGK